MSKREKILDAAIDIIGSQGLSAMNARTIAKEMKIVPSNVFYYFKTQEDLKQGVHIRIMNSAKQYVEQSISGIPLSDGAKRMEAYIEGSLNWAYDRPNEVRFFLFSISEVSTESKNQMVADSLRNGLNSMYQILAIGIAENHFKLSKNPTEAANYLHMLLTGATIHLLMFRPNKKDFLKLKKSLHAEVKSFLN